MGGADERPGEEERCSTFGPGYETERRRDVPTGRKDVGHPFSLVFVCKCPSPPTPVQSKELKEPRPYSQWLGHGNAKRDLSPYDLDMNGGKVKVSTYLFVQDGFYKPRRGETER